MSCGQGGQALWWSQRPAPPQRGIRGSQPGRWPSGQPAGTDGESRVARAWRLGEASMQTTGSAAAQGSHSVAGRLRCIAQYRPALANQHLLRGQPGLWAICPASGARGALPRSGMPCRLRQRLIRLAAASCRCGASGIARARVRRAACGKAMRHILLALVVQNGLIRHYHPGGRVRLPGGRGCPLSCGARHGPLAGVLQHLPPIWFAQARGGHVPLCSRAGGHVFAPG